MTSSTMKVLKSELWGSCCVPVQDSRFYPLSCSKVTALFLFLLLFLLGLMMQEGMVGTYNSVNLMAIVIGPSKGINPVILPDSGTSRSAAPKGSSFSSSEDSIVSGLGEGPAARCLSRAAHMLHRPVSQIIPSSPGLVSALAAYEKRHAECSRSHGQNWTETFLRSLNGSVLDNPSGCQVLIYIEGGAGLGNRLISLVSAFVFALFTNRVLLLDASETTGHVANLLCEPFPASSWSLPQSFPLELLAAAPDLSRVVADNFKTLESVLRLNLDHAQSWGDQKMFCAETRQHIQKVEWVSWTSNQYLVPRLLTFPEFWPQLPTLFPNPSHVFTYLSRYLLLPSNPLWEKIFRIYSTYLTSPAEKLVGIQIRRHSVPDTGEYSARAFQRVLHCLITHHILPNTSSEMRNPSKQRILESIPSTKGSSLSSSKPPLIDKGRRQQQQPEVTAVLVASLQQRYAEELQDLYTNFPTMDGSLVRVHIVSHEGMEWHSYDQAQKAFVEMWLLSLGDSLVTSSWSTFGYVAQGLGALRPFIVNLRGDLDLNVEDHMHNEAIPNSHCVVGQSPDPCNHYPFWPKEDCGNESSLTPAHQGWVDKHLGHCQDEFSGRQLIFQN